MPPVLRRLAAASVLVALAGDAVAAQPERTEPEAKAAFLQKMIAFITWPKESNQGTLRIAFLGHSPVAREFARLSREAPAGSRKCEVHYETADANLDGYQVVFLPLSGTRHIQALAERISSRPVLTVCESAGGCEKGIILTLLIADDRIRYDVNLKRARKAGLTFHSQVLQYAASVCEGSAP